MNRTTNQNIINNVAPWQSKGRWYYIFVENASSSITKIDPELENIITYIENTGITINNLEFVIADYKIVAHNKTDESEGACTLQINAGITTINIPSKCDCEIYVYGWMSDVQTA